MPWSAIDEVLFAGHLRGAQSAIDEALAALGYDSLVITAGVEHLAFLDDQNYPFRANPWFTWLVPTLPPPGG